MGGQAGWLLDQFQNHRMKLTLAISLISALLPSFAYPHDDAPGCQYIPKNVQGMTQHFVNFKDAALVIGNGPNDYKWLNCPCFTGVFQDGFLQTQSGESGLLYSNQAFLVPKYGEVQLSSTFKFYDDLKGSCNTTEIINMNENPFYGYGTVTAADWVTGWTFGFILTNYKIYAVYGRNPVHQDPYSTLYNFPFTYLIPIAPRWPAALYTFSLVMNAGAGTVSYRINEKEKLLLNRIGQALDRRFLVQTQVPDPNNCPDNFPQSFHIILGNGRLVASGAGKERVCQSALFNQCTQNIHQANGTDCVYQPIPQEPFEKIVQLTTVFQDLSVVQWDDAFNCREQDCRYECRIQACPYIPCGEDSSSSMSSSSSSSSSSDTRTLRCPRNPRGCPRKHSSSTSSSSTSDECGSMVGTEFFFNSAWSL